MSESNQDINQTCLSSRSFLLVASVFWIFYFFIGVILICSSLLDYSMLVWEGDTQNFLYEKPSTFLEHLTTNFVWQDGLVSTPQRSLIFGTPLYFLNSLLEARILSLTLVVSLSGVSLILAPNKTVRLSVLLFAGHPITIFYSLYGVSVGVAVALSMLLAVLAIRLLEYPNSLMCILFGALVALSSYEYTPVRFFGLIVLFGVIFYQLRAGQIKRSFLTLIFPSIVFLWNLYHGRVQYFYASRGEQLLNFLQQVDYIKMFFGREHLNSPLEMIFFLVKKNLPDLLKQFRISIHVVTHDPPLIPLTFGMFGFLGVIGLVKCVLTSKPEAFVIMAPLVSISVLLLLTTRVDTHRIAVLASPIAILAGIGLKYLLSLPYLRKVAFVVSVIFIVLNYCISVWTLKIS